MLIVQTKEVSRFVHEETNESNPFHKWTKQTCPSMGRSILNSMPSPIPEVQEYRVEKYLENDKKRKVGKKIKKE